MIWVAWRQHRTECLLMSGVLAVLAVFLFLTGLTLTQDTQQLGLTTCLHNTGGGCGGLAGIFVAQHQDLLQITGWFFFLPALPGLFLGAPLVARELEQRTYVLVWTQSITRLRWLSVKVALVLITTLLAASVVLPLLIWWFNPFAQVNGSFFPTIFDFEGPVLVGGALLALALGILAGTLVRRTVLAMFLTLVLFLAIRLPVEYVLRPHYEPAIVVTSPLTQAAPTLSTQDWILNSGALDTQGHLVTSWSCVGYQTIKSCEQATGIRSTYTAYQPADRFWTFQWIETGIYLGFSGLVLFASGWLVRRRLN